MAQLRITRLARGDIAAILATSEETWGAAARARYAALLAAALGTIARTPHGRATRDRSEVRPGMRSLHLARVRRGRGVRSPAHVVYYRADRSAINVVRVLHERMDPGAHLPARR